MYYVQHRINHIRNSRISQSTPNQHLFRVKSIISRTHVEKRVNMRVNCHCGFTDSVLRCNAYRSTVRLSYYVMNSFQVNRIASFFRIRNFLNLYNYGEWAHRLEQLFIFFFIFLSEQSNLSEKYIFWSFLFC